MIIFFLLLLPECVIQRWQQLFKCDFFVFEINVYIIRDELTHHP